MRTILLAFLLPFIIFSAFSQNTVGTLWKFNHADTNFQAASTFISKDIKATANDQQGCSYFYYAPSHTNDTSIYRLAKVSNQGVKLWDISVLPMSQTMRYEMFTNQSQHFLINDSNNNIILISTSLDTNNISLNQPGNSHFILLQKYDTMGNLVQEKKEYVPTTYSTSFGISSYSFNPVNNQIHVSFALQTGGTTHYYLRGFDSNYTTVFQKDFQYTSSMLLTNLSSPLITTSTNDVVVVFGRTVGQTLTRNILRSYSKTTGAMNFNDSTLLSSGVYAKKLTVLNNKIYVVINNLYKINLQGQLQGVSTAYFDSYLETNEPIAAKFYGFTYTTFTNPNLGYKLTVIDTNLTTTSSIPFPTSTPYNPHKTILKNGHLFVLGKTYNPTTHRNSLLVSKHLLNGTLSKMHSFIVNDSVGNYSGSYPLVDFSMDTDNKALVTFSNSFYTVINNMQYAKTKTISYKACIDCDSKLIVQTYFDANNNCNVDLSEQLVPNQLVHVQPSDDYFFTGSNGSLDYYSTNPSDTITVISPLFGTACNGNTYTYIATPATIDAVNFGFTAPTNPDLALTGAAGITRQNMQQNITVSVNNLGATTANATLQLIVDSAYSITSTTPTAASINGDTITWNLTNLSTFQSQQFYVNAYLPIAIPIGYNYHHFATVSTSLDNNASNDTLSLNGVVIGSYDPNHKIVFPEGIGADHLIANNQRLTYTIEFQNTGTDTAFNIYVTDAISSLLDLSTLRILGSSHPMTYTLNNRELTFFFNNIQLVDSTTNALGSIGFFQYSIMPFANKMGETIENTANIYFDYNLPIVTNTTSNKIGGPLSLEEPIKLATKFIVYPNPSQNGKGSIQVNLPSTQRLAIRLKNSFGATVAIRDFTPTEIGQQLISFAFEGLSNGLYFIELTQENKQVVEKLVVVE
ncbi:MAG: T9SS type A sorting domain-containing protein [Crocinitomicaceae bacterium]|nr:T9SS type A sorting domain-containing protein [Crocinitomicaceae bacterium]